MVSNYLCMLPVSTLPVRQGLAPRGNTTCPRKNQETQGRKQEEPEGKLRSKGKTRAQGEHECPKGRQRPKGKTTVKSDPQFAQLVDRATHGLFIGARIGKGMVSRTHNFAQVVPTQTQ